ncbi:MAG TPA: cupredoxin domain-containing protein [Patescibacteria group bacterium]|nr:cupredoxin domain-containing protein [Patescibacteria group bacterium]
MDKRLLYITVAILFLVGVMYYSVNKNAFLPKKDNSTDSPSNTQSEETKETVTLSKEGFSPKELTIKTGTRIIWINKSGDSATVNSDNHPDHLLFPFLNLGEFGAESSVQAVFEKAGTYNYHDHLNPSRTGTIIVQ